jgi:hypothetical protein
MSEPTSNQQPSLRAAIFRELPCAALLAAAFALFACLSWRTWPDILVDFGQELYVPWRLSTGEVLYRDIAWVTGPLSQYANSLLFRLFGVSLSTLIVSNLAVLTAIMAMLYVLFRQCGTRWSATFVGLFFLAVFAFSQYNLIGNYNYVCPYRHDVTHGLALGLVNLLCVARFGRTKRARWLVAAGICLGLLALAKIEMVLAAFLTIAAALPLFACQTTARARHENTPMSQSAGLRLLISIGDMARWSGIVAASAVVPLGIAVASLAGPLGWSASLGQIFVQYRLALAPDLSAGSGFYRNVSGSNRVAENLINMSFVTVVVLAVVVTGYVVEIIFGRVKRAKVWGVVIGVVAFYSSSLVILPNEWQTAPACLPLLLVPVILLSLRRAFREIDGDRPASVLFLTAIFGASLLLKILLHVRWSHYGFVLAAPGTLVLIHVIQHTIPTWLKKYKRTGWCYQAVTVGLMTACALSLVFNWVLIDERKTAIVGAESDGFYADPLQDGRTVPTVNTLAFLRERLGPDDTLIVFPNGVMLNYLLRARNPTPYIMFSPWESDVHGGEDRVADAVIGAAPDYAVILTMDLTIHGRGNFGDPEFGGRIRRFLDEQYEVVNHEWSDTGVDGPFVAAVFKRRSKN